MSIVRLLVTAHVGLTAALLLLFACVVLCQRLAAHARPSAGATSLPSRSSEPYPSEPASVLDWAVDLRSPAPSAARRVGAGAALSASS